MLSPAFFCAFVCLFVSRTSTKFDGKVAHEPQKKPLDGVGGDLCHITLGLQLGGAVTILWYSRYYCRFSAASLAFRV